MAKKIEWTVRVILHHYEPGKRPLGLEGYDSKAALLLESLRYAGLVHILQDNDESLIFEMRAHKGLDTEMWAKMNAERMRSFGYDAVKAPLWQAGDYLTRTTSAQLVEVEPQSDRDTGFSMGRPADATIERGYVERKPKK